MLAPKEPAGGFFFRSLRSRGISRSIRRAQAKDPKTPAQRSVPKGIQAMSKSPRRPRARRPDADGSGTAAAATRRGTRRRGRWRPAAAGGTRSPPRRSPRKDPQRPRRSLAMPKTSAPPPPPKKKKHGAFQRPLGRLALGWVSGRDFAKREPNSSTKNHSPRLWPRPTAHVSPGQGAALAAGPDAHAGPVQQLPALRVHPTSLAKPTREAAKPRGRNGVVGVSMTR